MNPEDMKRLLESARPDKALPPGVRGAVVRYRFDVRGGGGSWTLKLDQGLLALEADGGSVDSVVVCEKDDLPKLLSGEKNILTAWMRGDVEISGEPGSTKLLHTYLRHAKGAQRKKRAA